MKYTTPASKSLKEIDMKLVSFIGIERARKNEWWDLFCSFSCCVAVYGRESIGDSKFFSDQHAFKELTGCGIKGVRCFNCNKLIEQE